MFILYDRRSGRYVGTGGRLTLDATEAVAFELFIDSIRRVTSRSCEPRSLVAVRIGDTSLNTPTASSAAVA